MTFKKGLSDSFAYCSLWFNIKFSYSVFVFRVRVVLGVTVRVSIRDELCLGLRLGVWLELGIGFGIKSWVKLGFRSLYILSFNTVDSTKLRPGHQRHLVADYS